MNSLDDLDASELSIEDASSLPTDSKGTIREKSKVRLTSDPSKIGMVFSVETFGPTHKYEVFIDGGINTFYDGQIQLIEDSSEVQWEKSKISGTALPLTRSIIPVQAICILLIPPKSTLSHTNSALLLS